MRYQLTIPNWRPTPLNKLMYAKVRQRIKLKKEDEKMIGIYAWLSRVPNALGKRRIRLEITLSGRQREADIDAYQKSLLDGLVTCGLLMGDTQGLAEWGGVTYKRGESQTVIILEDVE